MVLANVAAEDEAEFNRWYDREHMRERLEIPGFLSAQRYMSASRSPWRYLALYETEGLATLRSPAYLQALAHQSGWSRSTLGKFRDPQRCVAERTCSTGHGTGAAVSLTRLRPSPGKSAELRTAISAELLPRLLDNDAVVRASLMESDAGLSRPVPEYPRSTIDLIRPDDWFVAVDAVTAAAARFQVPKSVEAELVEALQPIGSFSLLWDLHRSDLGLPEAGSVG
jgi:hypothetical protein